MFTDTPLSFFNVMSSIYFLTQLLKALLIFLFFTLNYSTPLHSSSSKLPSPSNHAVSTQHAHNTLLYLFFHSPSLAPCSRPKFTLPRLAWRLARYRIRSIFYRNCNTRQTGRPSCKLLFFVLLMYDSCFRLD